MKVKIKILKENVLHLIKSTTLFYDFIVSILGLFSIILAPQILSITNIKDKAIIGLLITTICIGISLAVKIGKQTKILSDLNFYSKLSEQDRNIAFSLVYRLNEIQRRRQPEYNLVSDVFFKAKQTIDNSFHNSDFAVENLLSSSSLLLKQLTSDDEFFAVNIMFDGQSWRNNFEIEKYINLSVKKRNEGVLITRVFALKDEMHFRKFEDIFQKQADAGIDILITFKTDELYANFRKGFNFVKKLGEPCIALEATPNKQSENNCAMVFFNKNKLYDLASQYMEIRSCSKKFVEVKNSIHNTTS